jgi:hypothetical protein
MTRFALIADFLKTLRACTTILDGKIEIPDERRVKLDSALCGCGGPLVHYPFDLL